MLNIFANFDFFVLLKLILLFFFSIITYICFYNLLEQKYIKTIQIFGTILFLPVCSFVITSVISGNIALSLGMVGALSIIRFRNPVRSPLELTLYFILITLGISAYVSIKISAIFIIFIFILGLFIKFASMFYKKKYNKNFFNISFDDGSNKTTLNIISTKNIKYAEESEYLIYESTDNNSNKINYVLCSPTRNDLEHTITKIKKEKNVIEYSFTSNK